MKHSIIFVLILLILLGCEQATNEKKRIYYPTGELKTIGRYLNDSTPTDTIFNFYHNGKISSILYFDSIGRQTGFNKFYHESGSIKQLQFYKDGVLDGAIKEYSISGVLTTIANYRNGIKVGESFFYDDSTGMLELYNFFDFESRNLLVREYSKGKLVMSIGDIFLIDTVLNFNDTLIDRDFLQIDLLIANLPNSKVEVSVIRRDCSNNAIDTTIVNEKQTVQRLNVRITEDVCEVWVKGKNYDSITQKNNYLLIKHLLK